ncbi:hypothetical protein SARC_04744 [Sphaeroforma arctica JP610]|uniref:TLDc domain-containing protein n=1 Tax=Sphaeroforma arctica JP610 TaxID=667725 RepID=A0A0L0G1K7_9EUKA|nr:hypothetical protein SARC_04744 [Sphaeroforma arctica JP610]KNC82975.1 hypothetical protein SARC_04744 [Sphaeroforma arctica JP610]|eukprot:XP_014156877.1 hypothetical protein SARC_04744 [Sphaeroforma arctica JP610]
MPDVTDGAMQQRPTPVGPVMMEVVDRLVSNTETIDRIMGEETVTTSLFHFECQTPGFTTVKEVEKTVNVPAFLASFRFVKELEMAEFTTQLRHNIDLGAYGTWDQVLALHNKLKDVLLRMIQNPDLAARIAAPVLVNLKNVETVLQSVETNLYDISAKSRLHEVQDECDRINQQMLDLIVGVGGSYEHRYHDSAILKSQPYLISCLVSQGWYPCQDTRLAYRATRDGFAAYDMYDNCLHLKDRCAIVLFRDAYDNVIGGSVNVWSVPDTQGAGVSIFTLANNGITPPTRFHFNYIRSGTNNGHVTPRLATVASRTAGIAWGRNDLKYDGEFVSASNFPDTYIDTTGLGPKVFGVRTSVIPEEIEVYELVTY